MVQKQLCNIAWTLETGLLDGQTEVMALSVFGLVENPDSNRWVWVLADLFICNILVKNTMCLIYGGKLESYESLEHSLASAAYSPNYRN